METSLATTVFRVKPGPFLGDKGNAAAGPVVLSAENGCWRVDGFWVWMLPECKKTLWDP